MGDIWKASTSFEHDDGDGVRACYFTSHDQLNTGERDSNNAVPVWNTSL